MTADDDRDDEPSSGPLLPPDDRLWRHPSELAFAGSAAVAVRPRPAGSSLLGRLRPRTVSSQLVTVALFSALVGAALATVVAYETGAFPGQRVTVPALERDVDSSPVITMASSGTPVGFEAGATRVRASCVTLLAHDAHGTRVATAVVWRSDGMAITAAHSVVGTDTLTATVGGSRHVSARVVAVDPASDLAVVKLVGTGYDPAPLGSALDLQVGEQVISVLPPASGSVPGDQGWVDALGMGLVSAGGTHLTDLVRVDTSVAPTAVGAPVIDERGAVIAITTAVGTLGQAVEYATPIDLAHAVALQLVTTGHVVPTWLGVEGDDLAPADARVLNVEGGAVVRRILPGSPAAAAGLHSGDVIVGIAGREVTSMANLIMAVHAEPAGSEIELDVETLGTVHERQVNVALTPRPAGIN